MPTAPVTDWGQAVLTSAAAALALFLSAVPRVIGFLAILIIGWIIAGVLAKAVAALLRTVHFNDLAHRSGLSGFVQRMGVGPDPAGLLADIAKWFVRLIVLVVAFDALGLPAVSQVLQQLLLWLPNLVVALVILVIAGLIATAVYNLVRGATAEAGLSSPNLLANVARITVWGFGIIVAVNQLGVADTLVNTLFMGVVGALALALGLAFGLGGRDTAAEIVRTWYREGQRVAPKLEQAIAAASREAPTDRDEPRTPAVPPREVLPLQARQDTLENEVMVRVPVRKEDVAVDKQAVVTEEVAVRPVQVEDVVRVDEVVRRERLQVETRGDVAATGPVEVDRDVRDGSPPAGPDAPTRHFDLDEPRRS